MKYAYSMLFYLLLVVSCATSPPTPTTAPTAQAASTQTPLLPTTPATDTPPPLTPTTTPPPTLIATMTAIATETATILPANTPLPRDTPTPTPFPFSLPTGQIYFLWDPAPLPSGGELSAEPNQSLYLALPGESPNDWEIEPVLNELYGWPLVALSPDQTKLAIRVLEDANQDGDISQQGFQRGFDRPNLYIYTLNDRTFRRITDDFPNVYSLTWFPDSQTLTYPNGDIIFSIDTSANLSKTQLAGPFPDGISQVAWSPGSNLLAIELYSGASYFFGKETSELFQIDELPSGIDPNIVWSPNNQFIAVTNTSVAGLFVVNPFSQEIISLVEPDVFCEFTWSPDGQKVAFYEGFGNSFNSISSASLYLWDSNSLTTTLVSQAERISQPVWLPDNSSLAVGFLDRGTGGLLLVDALTGVSHKLLQMADVTKIAPLSWSPDGQWLLFLSQQGNNSSLYVIHRNEGKAYLMLEITNSIEPSGVFWLP